MIVVDASCLYAVVSGAPGAEAVRRRMLADEAQAAPHVVDVEVMGVIRREHLRGELDDTTAELATEDLRSWPGDRYGHRPFLERAWDLRGGVRVWDAMYVALAEALDAPLLTFDVRLARAKGPRCTIEVIEVPGPAAPGLPTG